MGLTLIIAFFLKRSYKKKKTKSSFEYVLSGSQRKNFLPIYTIHLTLTFLKNGTKSFPKFISENLKN